MNDWLRYGKAASVLAGAAGVTAAYLWATSEPEGFKLNDMSILASQSIDQPGTPACKSSLFLEGKPFLEASNKPDATLYGNFLKGVSIGEHSPCYGWRSSSSSGFDNWLTYGEVLEVVTHVGYGIRTLGQRPNNDCFIGIFSRNRPEMAMIQLSCYQHSMTPVPMYDTLGDESIQFICKQTKMEFIMCDTEAKIKCLLKFGDRLESIKSIIHVESISEETRERVKARGWTFMSFEELRVKGRSNPVEFVLCKPDDLCVVCYTSGTTGQPKGAMLTHKNVISNSHALLVDTERLYPGIIKEREEVYFSYLPLAHMYEQIVFVQLYRIAARIGFYTGDIKMLVDDLKLLRPTFFASVPRLLNRIYDKVYASVCKSKWKLWMFNKALNGKEYYFKRGIITKATIWDKLVFAKIQEYLGGRVKVIATGSAPIAPQIMRFLKLAFGAVVCEGYGQTECVAGMSVTLPNDDCAGEVGAPLSCCMIKLVDVPEMNYYAANNEGEVCCYGPNVFKGYLYDEERTREAIDSEGWLHTGDIGRWTKRGTLMIVDRKKNIFKLAQGEYVAPEKIENIYCRSTLVAQCFVHGESLKASLVAIIVPDAEVLPEYAKDQLGLQGSMTELCENPLVKKAVFDSILDCGKKQGLKGFEQVRDIYLTPEMFSVDNNLLTPTFKLKRVDSKKHFQRFIDAMYKELD